MSIHRCQVCGKDPGVFFYWTTSRTFPRDKLISYLNITNKQTIRAINNDGYKVCEECRRKLDE